MDKFIDRGSLSGQNKGRGELNVNLIYAILVIIAIASIVIISQIKS